MAGDELAQDSHRQVRLAYAGGPLEQQTGFDIGECSDELLSDELGLLERAVDAAV